MLIKVPDIVFEKRRNVGCILLAALLQMLSSVVDAHSHRRVVGRHGKDVDQRHLAHRGPISKKCQAKQQSTCKELFLVFGLAVFVVQPKEWSSDFFPAWTNKVL